MKRILLTAAIATLLTIATRAGWARESSPKLSDATKPSAGSDDVQRTVLDLIDQLGDDQYAVRRRAEEDLIRLGPEAFDQLKLAEDNRDLEVAERARYIVQRMNVEWIRPEDSPEIRRTLARYGDLTEADRAKRIARLTELKDDEGLPALCRIARLEQSPPIARRAALAVIKRARPTNGKLAVGDACLQELGASERPPVVWIQLWLREIADRQATLADWNKALAAEAALLKEESSETSFEVVDALMKRRLQMCHELGLINETTDALLAWVDLWGTADNAGQLSANLGRAIQWIIDHKRWDVLEQVEQQRGEQLRGNRTLLYYLAAAKSRSDRSDEANKLSIQAFEMPAENAVERIEVAGSLGGLGFVDWAEREYRKALEDAPVVSLESLQARRDWAMWLHDREKYKEAADVLDEFFVAMAEDGPARKQIIRRMDGRQYLNSINARREFYLACHYESRREYARQRESLQKAATLYGDDPDVLIAMYRSPEADEEFHKQAVAKIQEMSQRYLALIQQYPDEAYVYNQCAWLVSNTEGDYGKAVEHSRRSLELAPDEPSYLDTLGRCYYAAGDLENAVKSQRRAVALAPHYEVMQRQLKQFERELAAKQSK